MAITACEAPGKTQPLAALRPWIPDIRMYDWKLSFCVLKPCDQLATGLQTHCNLIVIPGLSIELNCGHGEGGCASRPTMFRLARSRHGSHGGCEIVEMYKE
jgi:hypothetical protein